VDLPLPDRTPDRAGGSMSQLPAYLTPSEVARQLNTTVAHLARLRCVGRGPVWYKLGRKLVRYEQEALNSWVDAQSCTQVRSRRKETP
jgi:hypothetical protein